MQAYCKKIDCINYNNENQYHEIDDPCKCINIRMMNDCMSHGYIRYIPRIVPGKILSKVSDTMLDEVRDWLEYNTGLFIDVTRKKELMDILEKYL